MSIFIKTDERGRLLSWVMSDMADDDYVLLSDAESPPNGSVSDWFFDGVQLVYSPRPSMAHEWDAKKQTWVTDKAKQTILQAEQLAEARAAKIVEIGDVAQAFVDNLIKDTAPEFERATYPAQQDDALAWLADNAAKTPTLDAIAKARGVPVEILRKKAADKVVAYRALAASVVGQRQAFEDKLNAAKTLADVEAIVPVYKIG